jgi:DNA-binding HxlR family transcriptional regulator
MRLVWELRRDTLSFSALRECLEVSPSVLSTRRGEPAEAGIVGQDAGRRYTLTPSGRELARLLYDINRWAERSRLRT